MTARELALRVVRDVFPDAAGAPERSAHAAFDYHVRRAQLSERDVAFAAELAYGAIKMRRALDWYLAFDAPQVEKLRTLAPLIREVLRLGVYELVYTRADEYATVFEFVNLAKRFGHRGIANLVNAVLRRFLRDPRKDLTRERFTDEHEYLATRYSLPTWLVRQWGRTFPASLEAICAAVDEPAQAAVTIDTRRWTPEEAAAQLQDRGTATRPSSVVPESLLLESGRAPERADQGWWPQSESSAMPVDVLNPQPGESIADLCSGRGNKALQIGARLKNVGSLLCVERDERKAAVLGRRLEAAGLTAGVVVGDATAELLPSDRLFDRVLLDAPCSGTGIVGRQPEARWKKQSTDGERLASTQRALLERAARYVYPGGALVYAVCSTDPRETSDVMEWFLSRENFERGLIPAPYEGLLTPEGDVLVPPGIAGRDGFYICRVERRA
ncbi:MAG TPA: transcription antitermination factor NusB [Candidatus Cybelea sp.]|nr:transcription antitermination factor NusB [Candidatus Cybelea sp.]